MRFLNLSLSDLAPDAKIIWLFREQLTRAGLVKALSQKFDNYLSENGFTAGKGQIVGASIVKVSAMRNSKDENHRIKDGEPPEDCSKNKRSQKDTDARWTKKRGKNTSDTRTISVWI